ncbi:MAG: type II toxin-antitoxin system VapC family toxin [Pseudomarimonas sp.]
MNLLLDTQVLLWALLDPARLSEQAKQQIEDASHSVYFSVASIWEIAIKSSTGRSDMPPPPKAIVVGARQAGFLQLDITSQHAVAVLELPPIHRDPFGRMLVAQARSEPMTLLTRDTTLAKYGDHVRLI